MATDTDATEQQIEKLSGELTNNPSLKLRSKEAGCSASPLQVARYFAALSIRHEYLPKSPFY
jgi:hypothetical protein